MNVAAAIDREVLLDLSAASAWTAWGRSRREGLSTASPPSAHSVRLRGFGAPGGAGPP